MIFSFSLSIQRSSRQSFLVVTVSAARFPFSSIFHFPSIPKIFETFKMELPFKFRSPKKVTFTFPDCWSTENAFVPIEIELPSLLKFDFNRGSSSLEYPRFTNTKIFPHLVSELVEELHWVPLDPSNDSSAIPTVTPSLVAFIPTPAKEDEVILSPILMGPDSVETLTGTRPTRAILWGWEAVFLTSSPKV